MGSGDWTEESAAAIELCKAWTKRIQAEISCYVYLFGSAIYEGGDQFDAQLSDIDIVVHFREELDATQRAIRMAKLKASKAMLELEMVPRLHRSNCVEPGISVLPITTFELCANIHKSKTRRFFDRNIFLNLETDQESIGLPSAGILSVTDEARQALELAQNVRNHFLAVSANGTGGLAPFGGGDPVPKTLARAAAQLVPDSAVGSWYDTRFGLEYLCEELSRRRGDTEEIGNLYRTISVRRGGRGRRATLSDFDQLLLAEILYDRAAAKPTEPAATWEIRFAGEPPNIADQSRLLGLLRGLAPDAEVLSIIYGSIIVRLRSSMQSYRTVLRLSDLGVLPKFFEVGEVDLRFLEGDAAEQGFTTYGIIDRIADRIEAWRPLSRDSMVVTEAKLARWLEEWLRESDDFASVAIAREAIVRDADRPIRTDILMQFPSGLIGQTALADQRVAVEVVRLRRRRDFFAQIDHARRIALPTILVLIGTPDKLSELEADIQALTSMGSAIRVVRVKIDNG
tara:strand:+ start:8996 stop:10534 length:1539 start_codon:yes stop_codon:yes gene_type:complete